MNVQAVNKQVETLNTEVINISSLNKSKQEIVKQQQQLQLAEYLCGRIDEAEYRNRMAALVKFQGTETIMDVNLFGLEMFDPQQNMSDVRDLSIENLFGWSVGSQKIKDQRERSLERTGPLALPNSQVSDDQSKSENDTINEG